MTRTHALLLALALSATSCSTLGPRTPPEQDAAVHLDHGLAALDAGRYDDAFDDLAWVYSHCPGHTAAYRAAAALAALELDPRNPAGRPGVGTEVLGRLIRSPGLPAWTRPLAKSAYLAALELGAPAAPPGLTLPDPTGASDTASALPERTEPTPPPPAAVPVRGCGKAIVFDGWVPPSDPRLPGPSLAAVLEQTEAQRDTLAAARDTLALELRVVRVQLDSLRGELARIRRTLKP